MQLTLAAEDTPAAAADAFFDARRAPGAAPPGDGPSPDCRPQRLHSAPGNRGRKSAAWPPSSPWMVVSSRFWVTLRRRSGPPGRMPSPRSLASFSRLTDHRRPERPTQAAGDDPGQQHHHAGRLSTAPGPPPSPSRNSGASTGGRLTPVWHQAPWSSGWLADPEKKPPPTPTITGTGASDRVWNKPCHGFTPEVPAVD